MENNELKKANYFLKIAILLIVLSVGIFIFIYRAEIFKKFVNNENKVHTRIATEYHINSFKLINPIYYEEYMDAIDLETVSKKSSLSNDNLIEEIKIENGKLLVLVDNKVVYTIDDIGKIVQARLQFDVSKGEVIAVLNDKNELYLYYFDAYFDNNDQVIIKFIEKKLLDVNVNAFDFIEGNNLSLTRNMGQNLIIVTNKNFYAKKKYKDIDDMINGKTSLDLVYKEEYLESSDLTSKVISCRKENCADNRIEEIKIENGKLLVLVDNKVVYTIDDIGKIVQARLQFDVSKGEAIAVLNDKNELYLYYFDTYIDNNNQVMIEFIDKKLVDINVDSFDFIDGNRLSLSKCEGQRLVLVVLKNNESVYLYQNSFDILLEKINLDDEISGNSTEGLIEKLKIIDKNKLCIYVNQECVNTINDVGNILQVRLASTSIEDNIYNGCEYITVLNDKNELYLYLYDSETNTLYNKLLIDTDVIKVDIIHSKKIVGMLDLIVEKKDHNLIIHYDIVDYYSENSR